TNPKLLYCNADNSLIVSNFNPNEIKNFFIYNSVGEKMPVSYRVNRNKIFLNDKLPAGLYFANLIENNKQLNCKMLVFPER
ncbi:MAG TPA: T9SS type A sorting domain-containing protein, partial [Bacteroidia bacterium]|nr:T9SS type A sorting domain-containing protein [Bacteroidia bacterium]